MDRLKLTTIAHSDHVFCNPLSSEKVDRTLGLLDLGPGSGVLDVGCGKAEMLIRLVERFHARGVGIDRNPAFLGEARGKAASRLPHDAVLDLREEDASEALLGISSDSRTAPRPSLGRGSDRSGDARRGVEGAVPTDARPDTDRPRVPSPGSERTAHWPPPPVVGSFHAALCVGSTHALGGYESTLRVLAGVVRPGGHLVIGEGFWRSKPDPEYLEVLDASPGDFTDHAGNVERAVKLGLIPLYASVSSEDDWDHYEGLYARAVERHVATHSHDSDAAEMKTYIRRWRDAYLRWGRSTLGFAVYLFQKPEEET